MKETSDGGASIWFQTLESSSIGLSKWMCWKHRRKKVKDNIILNPGIPWKYAHFSVKTSWETSRKTSRETSCETNWETRETRPREGGHTIHQRASWEKGGKASGRQTRHPTAAGRPANAHLHSHSVSVCFTAAMTCLCWYQTIPWLDIQQVFSVLVCTKRTLTKLNASQGTQEVALQLIGGCAQQHVCHFMYVNHKECSSKKINSCTTKSAQRSNTHVTSCAQRSNTYMSLHVHEVHEERGSKRIKSRTTKNAQRSNMNVTIQVITMDK